MNVDDIPEVDVAEMLGQPKKKATKKKAGADGKEYLNFKMISENDKLWKMCTYLQQQINELKKGQADILRNFGQVPDEEVGKANEELDEASELEKSLPF